MGTRFSKRYHKKIKFTEEEINAVYSLKATPVMEHYGN
jgi:hypothetical protein